MNQIFVRVLIFLILLFLFFFDLNNAGAFSGTKVPEPNLTNTPHQIVARKIDREAEILAKYLATHNSPLQYHAQDFIDASREYNLDWRLVAAISGVESTFGKHIPGGYNGWGWGVYGNQALYFESWKEGIYTVSQGLKENYVNRGLVTPYQMNRAYAASPKWGSKVTFFMNEIDKFAKEYEQSITDLGISTPRVAVSSGFLTYNTN